MKSHCITSFSITYFSENSITYRIYPIHQVVYLKSRAIIVCNGNEKTIWFKEQVPVRSDKFLEDFSLWKPLNSSLYFPNVVVIEEVEEYHSGRYLCDSYNKNQIPFRATSELLVASTFIKYFKINLNYPCTNAVPNQRENNT